MKEQLNALKKKRKNFRQNTKKWNILVKLNFQGHYQNDITYFLLQKVINMFHEMQST